jgi:NAD(P)-dependent dehydrogenase (short-subunit alcohol dehydrogenase family)
MSLFKKENKIDITGYDTVVVIIGGAGYVGKALLRACNDMHTGLFVVVSQNNVASGDNVISIRADMTKNPEVTIKKILSLVGRIDILIHAAAVYGFETAAALTAQKIVREFEVNTFMPLLVTQEVFRQHWSKFTQEENKKVERKVVVVGSQAGYGHSGQKKHIIYSATKAALSVAWEYYDEFLDEKGIESVFLRPGSLREKDSLDMFIQELKNAILCKY